MRATIHIGTHKTGTSSIQSLLFASRALLREQGCLYPQCLCYPERLRRDHLSDHNRLAHHLAFGTARDLLPPLRAELAEAGCRHLLISAEDLAQLLTAPQRLRSLQELLCELGCDEVRIAVWLRETGALFASLCSQLLKNGRPEYLHELLPHACPQFEAILDCRALLQRWGEVFGREALTVRLFEPECFVRGDLLCDAIAAFGLQWDERFSRPGHINESLNLLEMELLRVVNHLQGGTPVFAGTPKALLYEIMHRHLGLLDAPALRFAPPPQVTAAWREWAAAGNEWVRREFFPHRPTLFALPAEAEGRAGQAEIAGMPPEAWEALGRVLCELSSEVFLLRRERQLQRSRSQGTGGGLRTAAGS